MAAEFSRRFHFLSNFVESSREEVTEAIRRFAVEVPPSAGELRIGDSWVKPGIKLSETHFGFGLWTYGDRDLGRFWHILDAVRKERTAKV
jgi:hypothetical protein